MSSPATQESQPAASLQGPRAVSGLEELHNDYGASSASTHASQGATGRGRSSGPHCRRRSCAIM